MKTMEVTCPTCGDDLDRDYEGYIWCPRCGKRFILQGYEWPPYKVNITVYKYKGPQ